MNYKAAALGLIYLGIVGALVGLIRAWSCSGFRSALNERRRSGG